MSACTAQRQRNADSEDLAGTQWHGHHRGGSLTVLEEEGLSGVAGNMIYQMYLIRTQV